MSLTRDAAALRIRKWATAAGALKQTPETAGLTRSNGYTAPYGVDQFVQLETFNGLLEEITAGLAELAESGAFLPWNAAQQYRHYAYVVGSNGIVYKSVQDSLNQNPTTDSNNTYWEPIIAARAATGTELEAGTSSSLIVTPLRLLSALFKSNVHSRWRALTNRYGLVRRATSGEVSGRTGDGYVRSADLPVGISPPNSSTQVRGLIRTATQDEADAGSATQPAMTPALVQRRVNTKLTLWHGTQTQYNAINPKDPNTLYVVT